MRGGRRVTIEAHRHEGETRCLPPDGCKTYLCIFTGVFIARGKEDALVTKNLVPGESVYGEKRISVEVGLQHVAGSEVSSVPLCL